MTDDFGNTACREDLKIIAGCDYIWRNKDRNLFGLPIIIPTTAIKSGNGHRIKTPYDNQEHET